MARRQTPQTISPKTLRGIARDSSRPHEIRDAAIRRVILSIPKGRVASYGQVAAAAGYPCYHRAVARFLRTTPAQQLAWHRVIGAGGEIKLRNEAGSEQRLRLQMEGVAFRGRRVDMEKHQHAFRIWELD